MSNGKQTAARDHDGFTPVFLFAHDYGTHLPYCEILGIETSIKCTCGFKEALEAAFEAEEAYDLHDKERLHGC